MRLTSTAQSTQSMSPDKSVDRNYTEKKPFNSKMVKPLYLEFYAYQPRIKLPIPL